MATVKLISDLVAKISRNNKDRTIANDLLEIQRGLKGLETDLSNLTLARQQLTLENAKLKMDLVALKKAARADTAPSPSPSPATAPATQRVAVDFVWQPEEKKS